MLKCQHFFSRGTVFPAGARAPACAAYAPSRRTFRAAVHHEERLRPVRDLLGEDGEAVHVSLLRPVHGLRLDTQQLRRAPQQSPRVLLLLSILSSSSLIVDREVRGGGGGGVPEERQDDAGDLERPAVVHSTGGAGQRAVRAERGLVDVRQAL